MSNELLKDPKPLLVLEMANNHQGDIKHGIKIIDEFYEVCMPFTNQLNIALKFQYRDLDNLIHKDYKNSDLKYIKRFSETRLKLDEWKLLLGHAKSKGFYLICTPFDEQSVDKVIKDNFDVLKIASAYIDDWPLLEKISKQNIDIIASVGGAEIKKIKRFYSFMKNKQKNFAINYCVALYPTELRDTNLIYLEKLKAIFPDINLGFSTHEINQSSLTGVVAYSLGARLFEKHIALEDMTKGYKINGYSTTPQDLKIWLEQLAESINLIGSISDKEERVLALEEATLRDLKRGVYASREIEPGEVLDETNTYFSIPVLDKQVLSNDYSKYTTLVSKNKISTDEAIYSTSVDISESRPEIEKIREKFIELLNENNILSAKGKNLEISHHYGLENFYKTGCMMVTLFNVEYCKKIICLFSGQENPEHFHKIKDESFIIISGDLTLILDGKKIEMVAGEIVHIPKYTKHSFSSKTGVLFEEISTKHFSDDSFYTDQVIMENNNRKSKIKIL
jgi:N-acetylneuraminate synthase